MATAYLDYMKEHERFTFGPFVFAWFETNPEEHPDCRLCHCSRVGFYLASLVGEIEWERVPSEPTTQLVSLSDALGKVLLLTPFKEKDEAVKAMRQAREVGSTSDPERPFEN